MKNTNQTVRALLVAGLVLLNPLVTTPLLGGQPVRTDIDETFVESFGELCGVANLTVEIHVQGMLVDRQRDDTFSTTGANFQTTYTNVETGKSVVIRLSGLQEFSSETDGNLTTIRFSFSGGSKLVVEGEGVAIDVGQIAETIVFVTETGEIIEDTFVRNGRSDSSDLFTDLLCSGLSQ